MKEKERRDTRRVPIKVLVKCEGWEMWARDIADDGVGLRWSRGWASQKCPHWFDWLGNSHDSFKKPPCRCIQPPNHLQKGRKVTLNGLIYTDQGEQAIQGRVCWVRLGRNEQTFDVGIHVTSPHHRRYFKALES